MDNRMTGIRQKTGYIWAFLIAFLPRLFWSLQAIPLRTVSDELSTMNGAYSFLHRTGMPLYQKQDIMVLE